LQKIGSCSSNGANHAGRHTQAYIQADTNRNVRQQMEEWRQGRLEGVRRKEKGRTREEKGKDGRSKCWVTI